MVWDQLIGPDMKNVFSRGTNEPERFKYIYCPLVVRANKQGSAPRCKYIYGANFRISPCMLHVYRMKSKCAIGQSRISYYAFISSVVGFVLMLLMPVRTKEVYYLVCIKYTTTVHTLVIYNSKSWQPKTMRNNNKT